MKKYFHLIASAFVLTILTTINIHAQKWNAVDEKEINDRRSGLTRDIVPQKYLTFTTNVNTIRKQLLSSPNRFKNNGEQQNILNIPMPNGSIEQFVVTSSDVFHPDLAARYPLIKSYTGSSKTNPGSILKLSISHKGINGMILSDSHPTVYIDRYAKEMDDAYIVYYKKDYSKHLHDGEGHCTVETPKDDLVPMSESAKYGDCQLRKYRLALACTGEYAAFHGGNIPDVLAEYNASMTRVNGIYEKEFAITMELIANTDELIYLDADSDPYTNNSGSTMLGENQATIDDVIGFDNYDIGHVYSTGGGGIASLRSPCTTRKARGVTGLGNPTGDSFWVDYVAHEMGHQFGGNHSYNNSCNNNRNASTAYEPGSGSTIMAYAGICGPNVQNNSDDYFHSISIEEVANFVVAGNGDCAETITIDNSAPELDPLFGGGLILPVSTPFELTAVASDADNDGLTYCWEQKDNELVDMPPVAENTGGPAFRSYTPSSNPTRYFPRLESILIGTNGNTWETLPGVNREMNFTITVRDNNELGGCTANDDLAISFIDAAGPFLVTSQNTTTTWNAGTQESVTWDVANTDASPISCAEVDIYLSIDGGENFDILLAEGTTNDGEESIEVPFQFSSTCRIMIKCASSIFLDVNDSDFSIAAPFSAEIGPTSFEACMDQIATYQIDYTEFDENVEVNFDVMNLPAGATATFSDNPITEDGIYELAISDLQNVLPGTYILTVATSSSNLTLDQEVTLVVSPDSAPEIIPSAPLDAEANVSIFPTLGWNEDSSITQYEVELSYNPSFQDILTSQTTNTASASGFSLDVQTVYYWRVRAVSPCFESEWGPVQSFQTAGLSCLTTSEDTTIVIPEEVGVVSSSIIVPTEGILSLTELTLTINHSYVGDLIGRLISPSGTVVTLFDRPGVPASNFGCGNDNMNLQFSDFAPNSAADLEGTCSPGDFAIEGEFQPLELLDMLNGENMLGEWILEIEDTYEDDGGELVEWSITTCSSSPISSAIVLNNNGLILENETNKLITDQELLIENMNSESVFFVLRSAPQNGNLQRLNHTTGLFENLELGSVFTQYDLDQGDINYLVTGLSENSDQFLFDVVDDQTQYLANQIFNISYSFEGLNISAEITNAINCFGDTNGEITANATGGLEPLTYSIDGENFVASPIFSGLSPGSYTISVKDATGQVVMSNLANLEEPQEIILSIISNENEITINSEGGTGTLEFSIDGVTFSQANVFDVENGVEYTPTVRDANGCTIIGDSFTHYFISAVDFSSSNISCNGQDDGTLTVNTVSGGLAPYTYTIDGESNDTGLFTNLTPGVYVLEVLDANGNVNNQSFEITEPVLLEIFTMVNQDTIFVEGAGGVEPYLYSLDGELYQDDNFLIGEVGEVYTVYIIDQTGCVTTVDGVEILTAVSNPTLDGLKLYPNPASHHFQFGSQSSVKLTYEILDITGRLILSGTVEANSQIDISNLSEGLFICKVKADGGEKSFRLIVLD